MNKHNKLEKMVFFFPWSELSGGPFYLCRLADAVAASKLYDVYYTDYPHGLANSILTQKDVKILKYENEGKYFKVFPDEPITLVMPIYWAHMVPIVHSETKIVFFNWHNECIPVLKGCMHCTKDYINRFLECVRNTDSVFFLDKTHWMAQNTENIVFREKYVPIIIPTRSTTVKPQLISEKARNIAILGRLCADKIFAVLDLLDNIANLRDGYHTNVYVIGDGDCAYMLQNAKYPSWIKVISCGTMQYSKMLEFLPRKVDILFAMGTSILDGASIGMPSVVIPNDVKPFECNHYAFLHECNGYVVGWSPEQLEKLQFKTHTIAEIFEFVYTKQQKKELGQKCYDYYLKNHTDNLDQFLSAVNDSKLTASGYYAFKKRNINIKYLLWACRDFYYRCRGTLIKQYCVFGIPIFTYTKTIDMYRNVFILCLPILRIILYGAKTSVHFLPAIWVQRLVTRAYRKLKNWKVSN